MQKQRFFLSYGAGVQTTALLLAYERGLLKDKPEAAIFADTKTEPEKVYKHLEAVKKYVKTIPIIQASKGLSIPEFTRKYNYSIAPVFATKDNGTKVQKIMGRRNCTSLLKIQVVNREIRKLTNTRHKKLLPKTVKVAIGFSTDEIERLTDSREKWIENIFPLVFELNWSREDCKKYISETTDLKPTRSACWMCPYFSNAEWKDLKENHKADWAKAVAYDREIRNLKPGIKNYLHRSRTPLERVDLNKGKDQLDFFRTDCQGGCGV